MTDAEIIYRAMMLMLKSTAIAKDTTKTEWMEWRTLRLAYYPVSRVHRWFDPDGPINKVEALTVIRSLLK